MSVHTLLLIALALATGPSLAATPPAQEDPPAETASPQAQNASADEETDDPDAMADRLNGLQQLEQSITLRRRVGDAVVETETRTITLGRDDPVRPTEAARSPLEAARAEFDAAALTRLEAVSEAELEFAAADMDRDGFLSDAEFARLARETGVRFAGDAGPDDGALRMDFVAEIDARAAYFRALAGEDSRIGRNEYKARASSTFDAADANGDGVLMGAELGGFRAALRRPAASPAAMD